MVASLPSFGELGRQWNYQHSRRVLGLTDDLSAWRNSLPRDLRNKYRDAAHEAVSIYMEQAHGIKDLRDPHEGDPDDCATFAWMARALQLEITDLISQCERVIAEEP